MDDYSNLVACPPFEPEMFTEEEKMDLQRQRVRNATAGEWKSFCCLRRELKQEDVDSSLGTNISNSPY